MNGVDVELRMVPVNDRVVEADPHAGFAARVHVFAHDVTAERRVGYLVVRGLRVPHAEALMVLRGQDHVLHAGRLGPRHPLLGVVAVWVEALHVSGFVVFRPDVLVALHPFVPSQRRIESEVDEHSKPGLCPPCHARVLLGLRLLGEERAFVKLQRLLAVVAWERHCRNRRKCRACGNQCPVYECHYQPFYFTTIP